MLSLFRIIQYNWKLLEEDNSILGVILIIIRLPGIDSRERYRVRSTLRGTEPKVTITIYVESKYISPRNELGVI